MCIINNETKLPDIEGAMPNGLEEGRSMEKCNWHRGCTGFIEVENRANFLGCVDHALATVVC